MALACHTLGQLTRVAFDNVFTCNELDSEAESLQELDFAAGHLNLRMVLAAEPAGRHLLGNSLFFKEQGPCSLRETESFRLHFSCW
jgi:hypothetical protein